MTAPEVNPATIRRWRSSAKTISGTDTGTEPAEPPAGEVLPAGGPVEGRLPGDTAVRLRR